MKTFSKILLLFLSLSSVLSNLRTLEDLKVTKKTILVKPNQIFSIKLYINPSTGYSLANGKRKLIRFYLHSKRKRSDKGRLSFG